MLFLVDPQGKSVRLETGYDLEGIFTDAFTGYVEREQMLPFFVAGRIAPGIEATVELLVARALQDNALRELEKSIKNAETLAEDSLAVIRFPVSNRQTSPYFLEKGHEGWMIDFYSMNQLIRFNHKNQWHFIKSEHKFAFAFTDLHFDKHGFPHQHP